MPRFHKILRSTALTFCHSRQVTQDWKLQVSDDPKKAWLFNLAEDPTEQNNLATSEPEKLAELKALLAEHKASAREPLYPFVADMPVAVDKTLATKFVEGDEYISWPN